MPSVNHVWPDLERYRHIGGARARRDSDGIVEQRLGRAHLHQQGRQAGEVPRGVGKSADWQDHRRRDRRRQVLPDRASESADRRRLWPPGAHLSFQGRPKAKPAMRIRARAGWNRAGSSLGRAKARRRHCPRRTRFAAAQCLDQGERHRRRGHHRARPERGFPGRAGTLPPACARGPRVRPPRPAAMASD